MKTLKGTHKLSCIETSSCLVESLLFSEVIKELTSVQEVHDEVELIRCLEGIV